MKMNYCFVAFMLILCVACTTSESKSAATESKKVTQVTTPIVDKPAPDNSDIREFGLLKEVEDSGYPFATLTIEFPERKFTETFSINLEEVKDVQMAMLTSWVGQYVSFDYTSDLTNAVFDIRKNGKTLLKDIDINISKDTKQVTGILSGADEETTGDLPGAFTITTDDNTTMDFPFFITKELAEANKTSVVVFYEERTSNKISTIKVSPK